MSVVVALKTNGKVLVGADSQVTKGGTRTTMSNPNNYKVWKVKGVGHCLMAHVGTVRDANIIRVMHDLVPEIVALKDNIDYEFVVTSVVPHIFDELNDYGICNKIEGRPCMDSSFIFAYKDKLFTISADGCVIEVDDYCSIGSGACEATGSLLSTDKLDSEERVKIAIKASAASDIYVDYPIVLANTEDDKVKIFTEEDFK